MLTVAIPAVLVLLVSMATGAISTSYMFKNTTFEANTENGKEIQNDDLIITRGDEELSRSSNQTSQFDGQYGKVEINTGQTEIPPDDLSSRIESLETNNSYLKSKMKAMISEHEELKSQYYILKGNYTKALETNSDLEELMAYYEERIAFQNGSALLLENKLSESISPPYTFIKDREIFWVFKDSLGNKHTWSIPIDTYRALIGRIEPDDEKILRSDDGKVYRVRDHTKFVDSSISPWVDEILRAISNDGIKGNINDSRFVHEVWFIASQLTTHSSDLGEDPKWPLETLVEGGGDCEDFAILLASMLRASQHTKDWQIQMVYFDIDHPDSPEEVNHVSLFIKTDEFETYVDRSLDPSKNKSWEYVQGWYFDI